MKNITKKERDQKELTRIRRLCMHKGTEAQYSEKYNQTIWVCTKCGKKML
jgi:hypothetical protein